MCEAKCPHCGKPLRFRIQTPTTTPVETLPIQHLKKILSEEHVKVLRFEDLGESVKITPTKYLGGKMWAEIAAILEPLGAEWETVGRDSHWKLPKMKLQ